VIDGKFQDYKMEKRPLPAEGEDPEVLHQYMYQNANSAWSLCAVHLSPSGEELWFYWGS